MTHDRTQHKSEASNTFGGEPFLTYVRTLQHFQNRLKGESYVKPVHIPQKEIETRFFPYPQYIREIELGKLVKSKQLTIDTAKSPTTGRNMLMYSCLTGGTIDISMMPGREIPKGYEQMAAHLLSVSLKTGAPSTDYFDTFLKYKDSFLSQFFTVDGFSNRVHTPITNFHRIYRPNILLDGQPTQGLDVAQSQPTILGKLLKDFVGSNEFSNWIDSGQDVYIMLQHKTGLRTRDDGKKRFFEILFAKPNDELSQLFGNAEWISWINDFKRKQLPENPHSQLKPHSNMAWLLSSTEVRIMRKVWRKLLDYNVPFLSVHDELIVKRTDLHNAERLFREVLDTEFPYYELRTK